jgi:asparagine synthase (glutamine-hydrolysing)
MCGIAGAVGNITFASEPALCSLEHRGRDSHGNVYEGVGPDALRLVHTRLAIQDLSPHGKQPMVSADQRYVLCYNGEIYNFRELMDELKSQGVIFRSHCDTEVLLEGWAKHGPSFLDRCNGMFAFALWDRHARSLHLVRDRLGIKPLYYTLSSGGLAFASEIRTLRAAGSVESRISEQAVSAFLEFGCVYEPHTILKGVYALEPGTWITYQSGNMNSHAYWHLGNVKSHAFLNRDDAAHEVGELFRSSVNLRLVSDAPLGILLSSGVDSASILAVATQSESRKSITAFTVAFETQHAAMDESDRAQTLAHSMGVNWRSVRLKSDEIAASLFDFLDAMDQPTIDGANTFLVTRAASRDGLKVALSGLGGDEIFLGYRHAHFMSRVLKIGRVMAFLKQYVKGDWLPPNWVIARTPLKLQKAWDISTIDSSVASFVNFRRTLFSRSSRRMLGLVCEFEHTLPSEMLPNSLFGQWSFVELHGYMRNMLLRDADVFSMAHPLELRVPMLDYRLVDYVLGLPDTFRFVPGRQKPLLCDAVSDVRVQHLAQLAKQGFALPFHEWLVGPLREFAQNVFHDRVFWESHGFSVSMVQHVWKSFCGRPHASTWSRPWALVVLWSTLRKLQKNANSHKHLEAAGRLRVETPG